MKPLSKEIAEGWVAGCAVETLLMSIPLFLSVFAYLFFAIFNTFPENTTRIGSLIAAVVIFFVAFFLFVFGAAMLQHREWTRILSVISAYFCILLAFGFIAFGAIVLGNPSLIPATAAKNLPPAVIGISLIFLGIIVLLASLFSIWLFQINKEVRNVFKKRQKIDFSIAPQIIRGKGLMTLLNAAVFAGITILMIPLVPVFISLAKEPAEGVFLAIFFIFAFAIGTGILYAFGKAWLGFKNWVRILFIVVVSFSAALAFLKFVGILSFHEYAYEPIDAFFSMLGSFAVVGIEIWFLTRPQVVSLFTGQPRKAVKKK